MLADHLAARPDHERALSPDGRRWITVGNLLSATHPGEGPVVPISTADPVEAVRALTAAQRSGRLPLVLPPGVVVPPVPPVAGRLALATSGTTSAPRVVLRTAASWDAALQPFSQVTGQVPDDVAWAPGPPWSTLTLWALHHGLATGTPVVATGRWRSVPAGLDDVTVVHTVPAVLADILAARAGGVLPRLRLAVVAGAPLPAALRARAAELGTRVVEYYGAAELSFVAVDADGAGLRAFPGVRLRLRDGRIEVRSPYVALGYAGAAGPLTVVDGWAGVGDRGRLGTDGVLVVDGRAGDALDVGGTTVLVADVERVLGAVDGVVEVACVADPDPRRGGRPAAVVGATCADVDRVRLLRELRAAARRELPAPARPVRYAVVDALPLTASGKVDRDELRRVLVATSVADSS